MDVRTDIGKEPVVFCSGFRVTNKETEARGCENRLFCLNACDVILAGSLATTNAIRSRTLGVPVVTFTEVAQNSPSKGRGRFGAWQTGYEQGLPVMLVPSPSLCVWPRTEQLTSALHEADGQL